jgi:hypothetical protein
MMSIPICHGLGNPLWTVIHQVAQIMQAAILIFKMAADNSPFWSYFNLQVDV